MGLATVSGGLVQYCMNVSGLMVVRAYRTGYSLYMYMHMHMCIYVHVMHVQIPCPATSRNMNLSKTPHP